ncbi:hypothetical protein GDO78_010682 [Eleutherodactylus coqui]|uniref:SCAN domain-containing protein 3 n=1 Tax=Eleutherodactylus coqui TaxID=57060 RepID=A0A8J6F6R3_ELECQ|nr:hypothetical protein GDO78_010682 [Eleutherodactylus coqui]
MSEKKKCRQYSNEYLKYGFIPSPINGQLPLCLFCEKAFSNETMKPSRLSDHLAKMHSDKVGKPISFFQGSKSKFENHCTVGKLFGKSAFNTDKGLLASYKVSLLITQCGKLHTIGETCVLPAVKEIVSTMLGPDTCAMVKLIPLSNDTVSRRNDEMAADVEKTILDLLKNKLQIDESTVVEELLFTKYLSTKGPSIYKRVEEFFQEKNIPLTNVLACATDGALSMIGRYRGFIAHLKSAMPGIMAVHCVIHRQHLIDKHLCERLHDSLRYVINAVNEIKPHSLNERLFRKLRQDHDKEFERLLLHKEVRRRSREKCLRRFYGLLDTEVEFLWPTDPSLCNAIELRSLDVAYLTDIFSKLNEVNTKLQGDKMNFIKAKGIISSFIAKLDLHTNNLSRRKLTKEDMQTKFHDLCTLEIPTWVLNPFLAGVGKFQQRLQEQLIDLKHNLGEEKNSYPILWQEVKLLVLAFPSMYLVERGFSTVQQLLTKARNELQIYVRGDLRLQLTKIEPNIAKLASVY